MPKISFQFIAPHNVSLFVSDLLALNSHAFKPSLIDWSEWLYQSLIESMKEYAQLTRYAHSRIGLWSASYAAALEENLRWQVTVAQSLCQRMKPEVLEELITGWKKRGLIASTQAVSLP